MPPRSILATAAGLLAAALAPACQGQPALQEEHAQCDPDLGEDACVSGLDCVSADGGNTYQCALPQSQEASEPCNQDYGIDACGAGLFCAAFDGRTVATCYPLFSRRPGQTCLADEQCEYDKCESGACPLQAHYEPCIADAECQDGLRCEHGACLTP